MAAAAVPDGERDIELSIFSSSFRIFWDSASTVLLKPRREQNRLT